MKKITIAVMMILLLVSAVLMASCEKKEQEENEAIEIEEPAEKKVEKKKEEASEDTSEPVDLPEASRPYSISEGGIGYPGNGISLSGNVADSVNSSGVEIPDEVFLYDFLIRYKLFAGEDYDADDPAESFIMVRIASDDLVNESVYEFGKYREYTEEPDPRGWAEMGSFVTDRDTVDWLASNIFNLSEDGIAQAVSAAEDNKQLYAEGNKYYGVYVRTGVGKVSSVDIKECEKDGDEYWLSFDYIENGKSYGEGGSAKVEYKTIDGIGYWTLHEYSENS